MADGRIRLGLSYTNVGAAVKPGGCVRSAPPCMSLPHVCEYSSHLFRSVGADYVSCRVGSRPMARYGWG